MKNRMSADVVAFASLFLVITFLLPAKAQSQTTSPRLEGTAWRVTTMNWYPITDIPIFYGFGERGKADVLAFVTYQSLTELPHLEYDRSREVWNSPWKVAPGTFQTNQKVIQHSGVYRQNGLSIHLEFSDHIIDATVNGNHMEGEIKSTKGDPRGIKSKWSAERVYKDTAQVEPPEAASSDSSSHPHVVREANGDLHPADGYRWVNPNDPKDTRVELRPGLVSPEDGKLRPEPGYRWVNTDDPKDFRVELMPGLIKTEDGFRPAKGYRWVNPKDPKDIRVEPVP